MSSSRLTLFWGVVPVPTRLVAATTSSCMTEKPSPAPILPGDDSEKSPFIPGLSTSKLENGDDNQLLPPTPPFFPDIEEEELDFSGEETHALCNGSTELLILVSKKEPDQSAYPDQLTQMVCGWLPSATLCLSKLICQFEKRRVEFGGKKDTGSQKCRNKMSLLRTFGRQFATQCRVRIVMRSMSSESAVSHLENSVIGSEAPSSTETLSPPLSSIAGEAGVDAQLLKSIKKENDGQEGRGVDDEGDISSLISKHLRKGDRNGIMPLLSEARAKGIALTAEQQIGVVKMGCMGKKFFQKGMRDEAFIIYNELRDANMLTQPIIAEMAVRAAYDRSPLGFHLQELMKVYTSYGFEVTQDLWNRVLAGMFWSGKSNRITKHFFNQFKAGYKEKGWKLSKRTYQTIFRSYVNDKMSGGFAFLADVLDTYVESGHHLHNLVLDDLLTAATRKADAPAVEAILGIGLQNLLENPASFRSYFNSGRITGLLQAATSGRGKTTNIARFALEWANTCGIEPSEVDMALWVRSCLANRDYIDAVEVLVLTEKSGIDLRGGPYGGWLHREFALQLQVSANTKRPEAMDDVYSGLLDLARSDWPVPALALDAVITCAGMLGDHDKAFATFNEYEDLFGLKRDVTAYNALLGSVAFDKNAPGGTVRAQMAIMEKMEEEGIEPDGTTFSSLFTALAPNCHRHPPDEINSIIDVMEEKGVRPLPFTVARLAQILSYKDGERPLALVSRLEDIYRNLTGNDPIYLSKGKFAALPGCYRYFLVHQKDC